MLVRLTGNKVAARNPILDKILDQDLEQRSDDDLELSQNMMFNDSVGKKFNRVSLTSSFVRVALDLLDTASLDYEQAQGLDDLIDRAENSAQSKSVSRPPTTENFLR